MSRLPRQRPSSFDLLVIGGGIHGLFAALEAARAGRSVCLVERDDFGSGLSFNHQRTVHGGLRALESGQLAKLREQIAERRAWAIMAPHLLRPLAFMLPTRRGVLRSRLAIDAGFRLYDWFGRGRNDGLPETLHLPASRLESAETASRLFPGLDTDRLTGGAVWHDYQVRHPDRLNWLVALAAQRAGALLLNHAEAVALIHDGNRVIGAHVRDRVSEESADVPAQTTLICAGGAVSAVHRSFGLKGAPLLLSACNLLVDRPAIDVALAAPGASGRTLTATPWAGRWLIGTFQSNEPIEPSDARPTLDQVDAMVDDANSAFPSLQLRRRDVRLIHAGAVPAVEHRGRLELMPEPAFIDHARDGKTGVFTLVGVKFTTARLAALEALRRIGLRDPSHEDTRPVVLPHGGVEDAQAALHVVMTTSGVALDNDVVTHLVDWYGTEAADVLRASAAWGRTARLSQDCHVLDGEILYAIEHAHAHRLADVVLRRTVLGTSGHPGRAALAAAAAVMGDRLGWTPDERAAHVTEVERRYLLT